MQIHNEGLGKSLATAATIGAMGYAALKGGQALKHNADEYTKGMPSMSVPAEGSNRDDIVSYLKHINIGKPLDKKHIDYLQHLVDSSVDSGLKTRAQYILDQQKTIKADEAKITK
jgi:hypothetical protein